jgi:Zn-dependent M28 family amino/carboxypeptidase
VRVGLVLVFLAALALPGFLALARGEAWGTGAGTGTGSGTGTAFTAVAVDSLVGVRNRVDRDLLLQELQILSHDSMEGRRTGEEGNLRARRYLTAQLDALQAAHPGLAVPEGGRVQRFAFTPRGGSGTLTGENFMVMVPGTVDLDRYIVVTAHYDHLGVRDGATYNGADDNASGTAAVLALARWFATRPLEMSLLFVAFDAEEMGLQGARAFIADPPVPLDRILMNVNLDMVSRSDVGELYAVGSYHSPYLVDLVEEAAGQSGLTLRRGHDAPDLPPGDDWTMASDHGPFHQAGIPFLYFGVEDHPGYHQPSDVFEDITPDFYVEAVETVLDILLLVDRDRGLLASFRWPL